ncbi:hypothetical protein K488DRAFT_55735 [Vararia minispora EC-137]|uniref:Uncharacterized protein n=1 Tax=Vararia minispora EC-137 TaxID=1314806 RepID=A0ACB8QDI9_9AGAM|nr:hypothetical protein K488DRAFT_55735 [Vararia minispora EC-137]
MATTLASVPTYSLPGVPPLPQPRGAGDPPDATLATEILPAPPSLTSIHQVALAKQDPRKLSQPVSYLPQHDPGTTFSSYWATPVSTSVLDGPAEAEGRRPKRVRVGKECVLYSPIRISGLSVAAITPTVVEPIVMEDAIMLDALDEPIAAVSLDSMPASRANSVPGSQPAPAPQENGRRPGRPRKDKGKGKEREDVGEVRVKEEPLTVTLPPVDGPSSSLRNQDHCSACRSLGSLVYCDSCTRAYHLWCLDPPMEASDLPEGENRWFCPACNLAKHPRPKPPPSFLSPLIQQICSAPPTEFQLPEDIRGYFKNVGTNARGAYVDTSAFKPPRLNRLGQLEDRDPHRTKDRNGAPVLCHGCGTSAFSAPTPSAPRAIKRPRRMAAQNRLGSEGEWRSIVSCDYCSSHWHLDCLNPPLIAMPPFDKKWMCPNHAEHTLRIKPRIPKQNATIMDITRPGVPNNGNIEVLESGDTSYNSKMLVDEVFINGRKYRVPERVIKLDFWNRLNNIEPDPIPPSPSMSATSSLTSLSSLEDAVPPPSTSISSTPGFSRPDLSTWNVDDLRGALVSVSNTLTWSWYE